MRDLDLLLQATKYAILWWKERNKDRKTERPNDWTTDWHMCDSQYSQSSVHLSSLAYINGAFGRRSDNM